MRGSGRSPRAACGGLRGAAPPTPPPRTSALRGSGPPTRPRMFFLWGLRPHAPTRSAGLRRRRIVPPTPEAGPAPSPLAGEGGGEGSVAPPRGGAKPRGDNEPPRAHARPSPDRGKAPAGEPRSPPGTTPRLPTQPQDPEWIVEGGCGGEPPLGITAQSWTPAPSFATRGMARIVAGTPPALTRRCSSALLHMCRASPLGRRCASPPVSRASPARRRRQAGTGGEASFQRAAPRGFPPHKGRPRAAFVAFSSSGGTSTAPRPFASGSPSQGGQSE